MKTLRYNTETGQYTIHTGQYKTMDGRAGAIHPPIVQLEVVEVEKPEYTDLQKISMEYDISINEGEHDLFGTNGTATEVWTVTDKTEQEIAYEAAIADWRYPQWAKRIVAPIELILDDVGIKMYGWFQLNSFPVEKVGEDTVHLYCNVILPQHQAIVDELGEVVTVEDKPEVL